MKRALGNTMALAVFVAPRRGAWIETYVAYPFGHLSLTSHPAGVRGLKLSDDNLQGMVCYGSHPAGVRGLKRSIGSRLVSG